MVDQKTTTAGDGKHEVILNRHAESAMVRAAWRLACTSKVPKKMLLTQKFRVFGPLLVHNLGTLESL